MEDRYFVVSAPDDGVETITSRDQEGTEHACRDSLYDYADNDGKIDRESYDQALSLNPSCAAILLSTEEARVPWHLPAHQMFPFFQSSCRVSPRRVPFCRAEHAAYLMAGLGTLASGYASLDASRPWLCYWIVHSLAMLGEPHALSGQPAEDVVRFLSLCQTPGTGGYAGGPVPGQLAHLAPTYAAVNALVTIGTPSALASIDRPSLRRFLLRMKQPDGSFTMHDDGEVDVRGAYIAMSVATLLDLKDDELTKGTAEWIASCQTYEGGIGATPGEEAHGGYTFCGLAAMVLLGSADQLRLPQLAGWLTHRQMEMHGGFQGRTNKLVDGCYSFWQGGAFPLLESVLTQSGDLPRGGIASLFSTDGLLDYLYLCCQVKFGGMRDKPGKGRDYYHTCYCLSGLAVAAAEPPNEASGGGGPSPARTPKHWSAAVGLVNPVFNIVAPKVDAAIRYYQSADGGGGAASVALS